MQGGHRCSRAFPRKSKKVNKEVGSYPEPASEPRLRKSCGCVLGAPQREAKPQRCADSLSVPCLLPIQVEYENLLYSRHHLSSLGSRHRRCWKAWNPWREHRGRFARHSLQIPVGASSFVTSQIPPCCGRISHTHSIRVENLSCDPGPVQAARLTLVSPFRRQERPSPGALALRLATPAARVRQGSSASARCAKERNCQKLVPPPGNVCAPFLAWKMPRVPERAPSRWATWCVCTTDNVLENMPVPLLIRRRRGAWIWSP